MSTKLASDIEAILTEARKTSEKTAAEAKNALGEGGECATLSTSADMRKLAALIRDEPNDSVSVEDVVNLVSRVAR